MFLYVRPKCSFCHHRVLAVISNKLLNLSMCLSFPNSSNKTEQCLLCRTKTQVRANPRRGPTVTNRHITNRSPDLSSRFGRVFLSPCQTLQSQWPQSTYIHHTHKALSVILLQICSFSNITNLWNFVSFSHPVGHHTTMILPQKIFHKSLS